MIFSAATFLYLLPLAGLPIVFHLALKLKKRTVVFPTLMFFYRADPRLNSRRRIRNWLLLLLRVLLIAAILLMLSRPILRMAGGRRGSMSLVVLVDNSGSMSEGAHGQDRTKLECASEAARRLLLSLEGNVEAGLVLLVDDPAADVGSSLTTNRDELLTSLDRIRTTEATGDVARALTHAVGLVRGSKAAGGAIHVFTDLQEPEWGRTSGLELDPAAVHVYLHRIPTASRERANVAITGVQFPEQRILAGQPYEIGLSLRNGSELPAGIRVNHTDAQGDKSTQPITLQPHQVTTVPLPVKPVEQGYHWIKAWMEGDAFSADNSIGVGLWCEGVGTVSLIGERQEFGMLPVALSPLGDGQLTGLRTRFVTAARGDFDRSPPPLMTVTSWDSLREADAEGGRLSEYVEKGGCLLVVPSVLTTGRGRPSGVPGWLGGALKDRRTYAAGVRLEVLNRDAPFWRDVGRVVGEASAESVALYAFHPLDLSSEYTSLLGAGGENVVLAERAIGKGRVFVSGTAFSPRWNTLPLSGLGVVLMQRMALASDHHSPAEVLTAGERPRVATGNDETEVLSLAGDPLEWRGPSHAIPALPRTGVYLLKTGDEETCLSIRPSEKEGNARFVEATDLPLMGSVRHTVVAYDADRDYTRYHAAQARAAELYVPLLLLALLLMMVEGLLGAPPSYRPRGQGSVGRPGLSTIARRIIAHRESQPAPAVGVAGGDA